MSRRRVTTRGHTEVVFTERSVNAANDEELSVGGDIQRRRYSRLNVECKLLSVLGSVPQLHRLIIGDGNQFRAVRAEPELNDRSFGGDPCVHEWIDLGFRLRHDLPDSNAIIQTASDHMLAVRRKPYDVLILQRLAQRVEPHSG